MSGVKAIFSRMMHRKNSAVDRDRKTARKIKLVHDKSGASSLQLTNFKIRYLKDLFNVIKSLGSEIIKTLPDELKQGRLNFELGKSLEDGSPNNDHIFFGELIYTPESYLSDIFSDLELSDEKIGFKIGMKKPSDILPQFKYSTIVAGQYNYADIQLDSVPLTSITEPRKIEEYTFTIFNDSKDLHGTIASYLTMAYLNQTLPDERLVFHGLLRTNT